MIFYGIYDDPALMGEARNAAYSAVALAPELPEAQTALATMHQYLTFDWQAVEDAYEAAIAMGPQSSAPYHRYADFLWVTLQFNKAREMARRAIEIDPLDGSSMHAVGVVEMFAGNFQAAVEAFAEWNRFHPNSRWSYVKYALALSLNGQCDESADQIEAVEQLTGGRMSNLMHSWIAWAHRVCGRDAQYVAKRDHILASHAEHPDRIDPVLVGIYTTEGEFDKAIDILEIMVDQRHPTIMFTQINFLDYMGNPGVAEIHNNPRFKKLMQELDFPAPD